MTRRVVEYVTNSTPDVTADQVARLREIFPECVAEGRVDFERLRATLGDLDAFAGDETYSFTWAGRAEAFRAVQRPSADASIVSEKRAHSRRRYSASGRLR